ncbi:Origin recognition complex subunit 3 [Escovopsis weberi]|uniref:Origin recognition complex subunit 3 n=1 Tax=Escovopsis weberi TaxID=150374 RepID=A0A0M8N5I5_ESCWE|nr:Origin recognition complex subunit 3 [Escovopsis weberi]
MDVDDDDDASSHDFSQEDHQVAFIFDPDEGDDVKGLKHRPSKRRRVVNNSSSSLSSGSGSGNGNGSHDAGKASQEDSGDDHGASLFVPLLNGAEGPEFVQLRQRLFEESWGMVERRIRNILRESNSATLDEVSTFVNEAGPECGQRIPSAFIITGPNFASQDLLFEQLSERLQSSSGSKFVRLRSTDASNVKVALKKIIRDATSQADGDDGGDDLQVGHGQDGRRYLDYDLEALEAFARSQGCGHVFVGFQDSEAFDSSLLSDLILLFSSWRPRIPFTLLFGIATSVELLQARLLKSACRLVYGAQFDGIQTDAILESVFRGAVASSDVPLRLGGALLRGMLDRQHDHYAYMCHYYANPLSILLAPEVGDGMKPTREHLEAIRNLPSFRLSVEMAIQAGTRETLEHARSLVESDEYLLAKVQQSTSSRRQWLEDQLRTLLILEAAGARHPAFSRAFTETMVETPASASGSPDLVEGIRRMTTDALTRLLRRTMAIYSDGEPSLHLGPATRDADLELLGAITEIAARLETLKEEAEGKGITALRSKYSSQGKVTRTTIIAQRVQLRQDSAALRPEDVAFTEIVDRVADLLTSHAAATDSGTCGRSDSALASESWIYGSKSPLREVMVPRPRGAFERSLARPHDYLSCACCSAGAGQAADAGGGVRATLPATCILALVGARDIHDDGGGRGRGDGAGAGAGAGDVDGDGGEKEGGEGDDGGMDERQALVMFYRGLAELKALGFVKASRKKTDHIAKEEEEEEEDDDDDEEEEEDGATCG